MDPVAGFYAAYDRHDAALLSGVLAPGYRGIVNGRQVASPAEAEQFVAGFLGAFPDCRYTLHDRIERDGRVAVRWSFSATHRGPFAGLPATGKPASADGLTMFQVEAGRIVRLWSWWDAAGLVARLSGS
ncbi:MAG TPA: ester cyclase [Candidatus Thermoplasmatota archaeon]|nr:ester cyclase [Candidatus Thermoplasmatota archaeon]